ncbi:NAD-P-binding protein [Trametes versicolor FP-101664 SS1]|uniref:NAD-P-binding protein n=1 Tax=Trametes versicolor (strain FP-101664) TaxID=717944 RepID=UPI0004624661|nr:NAD-P-binding protein [Trametes versicolor FP-101664 SS1]EIW55471.1 NAD-P-binding protein [Trametes versicolor FP-101664 SS1]
MGGLFSSRAPKFDPAKDLADLTGKVAIVTGGNSGIGYATVQHLARQGAKVYIGARSEERAKAAIERLRAEGLQPRNGELEWLELDLSDPRKAKASAEAFLAKEKQLDILVNNAGVMRIPYKIDSTYGIQQNMVVNHFSPFVFTKALLPLLTETAKEPGSDVRIVIVSSQTIGMMKGRDVHFRDINEINEKFGNGIFSDMYRYAYSKLANALYAKQLQRRVDLEGIPITVMALHPGSVNTEGLRQDPSASIPILGRLVKFVMEHFLTGASEGAYASSFAAASPIVKAERDKYKGAYLDPPGKIVPPPAPEAESTELAEELWATTETILQSFDL